MVDLKNIDGHFYPPVHRGWGGFAEELFHYTSRYYVATEAFLRQLVGSGAFRMSGYSAARLSAPQRDLMAALLSCRPDAQTGAAIVTLVEAVCRGEEGVDAQTAARYLERLRKLPKQGIVEHHLAADLAVADVDPLDPFMSIAERLLMPVAVRDCHVEVSLHALARHLQSPNSTLRTNLHNAVLALHAAGFVLRNHPHLTHSEAQAIDQSGE